MSKANLFRRLGTSGSCRSDRGSRRRLLIEKLDQRQVLASIAGMVFDDPNATWRKEAGEVSLEQRLVYADTNDNRLPDDGERFALTAADGSFSLNELGDDAQIVRLFQAARSQVSLFPILPAVDPQPISLLQGGAEVVASSLALPRDLERRDAIAFGDTGVHTIDRDAKSAVSIDLGGLPFAAEAIGDDRWLVLASNAHGEHAFIVGPGDAVQPLALACGPLDLTAFGSEGLSQSTGTDGWFDIAIGSGGSGFLVPKSGDAETVLLHRILPGEMPTTMPTSTVLAPATRLLAGEGVTSIVAEPQAEGIAVSLWSNVTGTAISPAPVTFPDALRVLAYGETSGLLYVAVPSVANQAGQSILVLDVASGFAPLRTISGLGDINAIDTQRSLIFSLAPATGKLQVVDAVLAETIADWSLTASTDTITGFVNTVVDMALQPGGDELTLLAPGLVASVSLRAVDAHRVRGQALRESYPLRFATQVTGENTPPEFVSPLLFQTLQGVPLAVPNHTLLAAATDRDHDPLVVVRNSSPSNGSVQITPHGAMTYVPNPGFLGTDSFEVFLHDGRGASEITTVLISVVSQQPTMTIEIDPLPLNAQPGFVVGQIQTVGLAGPVIFQINDHRLIVIGNQILVAEQAQFDYQNEPRILTTITATDEATQMTLTATVDVELSDEYASIDDIQPRAASVRENAQGQSVAALTVISSDQDLEVLITVDDPRFQVVGRTLSLKDGVQLDHETEPTITLRITATDVREGGEAMSVPFVVTVQQAPLTPPTIELHGRSVIEFVRGDEVGMVTVDQQALDGRYSVVVDDSRFEIVNGRLKLRGGEYLTRAEQYQARVTITAMDSSGQRPSHSESFLIDVLANANPFHNQGSPLDVDDSGQVTPLDALLILNSISQAGGGGVISQFSPTGYYWDVNGDGVISPLDALLVLNHINQNSSATGISPSPADDEDEEEGESGLAPVPVPESPESDPVPQVPAESEIPTETTAFDDALSELDAISSLDEEERRKREGF